MEEYHKGKADTISGIEMKDEHTVVLHFKQMTPGMQTSGSGYLWEEAEPYEYLKDVPFDKIESCDQVRKNPVTFGPFKFSKIVQGESAEFVPNPYYWGKKPSLDKITIQTVSSASAGAALKSKKYDIMFDEPTSALDPEMINEVLDVMVELANEGMTMMVVTHEMGFARKVANRVIFMDEGKIVEDSPKDAFFDDPKSDRAKDFLAKILH